MELLEDIKKTILEAVPDAEVYVLDPQNDGVHLEAFVIASSFNGKTLVQQHQQVMEALQDHFASTLHALGLKTFTPERWGQVKQQYQEVFMDQNTQNIQQWIDEAIKTDRVVLFMKGTAKMPMCGFSARIAQILETLGVDFKDYNVLEDEALRQGIKDYSNWPTIPQLYISGQFVGGCDIVTQLYETGELETLTKDEG